MIGRWSCRAALVASLLLPGASARAQQIAGSVESGLQTLAQEIVAKSASADRDVIAVLPFPNADGTCSVLSTYLVDELIQALFSVPGSPLKIVERSQLEALIREIQIGEGGLLNPETTQKLGNISGVKALAVGTITEIGDRVRINARLVATDTGRTVSAAAVTVPRTGDVDGLLRRPIASGNGLCGEAAGTRQGGRASGGLSAAGGGVARPSPAPTRRGAVTLEGLSFSVQSATRATDGGAVSVIVEVLNTQSMPVRVLLVGPAPTAIDDAAGLLETETVSGVANCGNTRRPFMEVRYCARGSRTEWTILEPGLVRTVLMKFRGANGSRATSLTLAATLAVEPAGADEGRRQTSTMQQISLSLPDVLIRTAGR